MNIEETLNLSFVMLEDADEYRSIVIRRVIEHIKSGGSELKKALDVGAITMADVIRAIDNKRCLRAPDRDLGHTYLEQILGSAIRETIPVQHINRAREIFKLDKLPPSELVKHRESR